MKRKQFLGALGGGILAVFAGRSGYADDKPTRPNFLVILTDDQAYRAIGYINPLVQSPHLDALAAEGTRLDSMYVVSPICMASRASLMTGMYPQQHGAVALNSTAFQEKVKAGTQYVTLPELMTQAGYQTALYGKSHLGEPQTYGFLEGFERWDLNDENNRDEVVKFLRRQVGSEKPFFLWFAMYNPHLGFRAPQEFQDLYNDTDVKLDPNFLEQPPLESLYNQSWAGSVTFRDWSDKPNSGGPPRSAEMMKGITKKYWADVSCLDDRVGSVMDCLKETGQYDNTIILFLSDNGYFTGQHGLGNKTVLLEEGVRVPAFVSSPLLSNKGAISTSLVSTLDIFPTVLDYAGIEIPEHLMGKSWRPILENPSATIRDYVISESIGPPETRLGVGHRMIFDGRYKYILTSSDEEAFFDLKDDSYEMTNLVSNPEYSRELDRLRNRLGQWSETVGETRVKVKKETPGPMGIDNRSLVIKWREEMRNQAD